MFDMESDNFDIRAFDIEIFSNLNTHKAENHKIL